MKLLIPKGCRSDDFILPLIDKMEKDDFFEVYKLNITPANFIEAFNEMDHACKAWKPDLVFITGDRIEAAGACNAAFLANCKIAHLGAGIIGEDSTFDNMFRHCITLMADIALCEDQRGVSRTIQLWDDLGKINIDSLDELFEKKASYWNVHCIGNPYLEGLEDIDESLVPNEPYDLVLINKTTRMIDSGRIHFPNKKTIRIGSNPDGQGYGSNEVPISKDFIDYPNIPRPQFLGLLKNCTRYFTNSSSAYYEAIPLGLREDQIIIKGKRNSERSTPKDWSHQDYKSSDKIIEILKNYYNKIKNGSEN